MAKPPPTAAHPDPPDPPPGTTGSTGDRARHRLIYDTAWEVLGRYNISAADRDDLTETVVSTALARWDSYREEAGTPRQWIAGIAHNVVRHFRRTQARREKHEAEHADAALASTFDTQTPEDIVAMRELFEHLLGQVPIEQRRVVILVDMAHQTIREAAAVERVSSSTAHTRYKAGREALAAAAERWREEQKNRGVFPLPFTIEQLLAAGRPPPAPEEAWERAWSRMSAGMSSGGMSSGGPRLCEPSTVVAGVELPSYLLPNLDAAKVRFLRSLGVLGMIGGGFIAGAVFGPGRCGPERLRDERSIEIAAPMTTGTAPSVVADREPVAMGETPRDATPAAQVDPAPRVAETAPSGEAAAKLAETTTVRAARSSGDERLRTEQWLLDQGRSALERESPADALTAFEELGRRFPQGQTGVARERLRREACALVRARPQDGGGSAMVRCAGQP